MTTPSIPARWRLPRVLAIALIASLGLSACGPFGDDYAFQGGEIPAPNPAPAIALTDQHGQPFDLASQRGRAVLLFFGYTSCPDICPTTLSDFLAVQDQLGDRAIAVDFVFITVDPARDTPGRLAEYLTFFDPAFIGLTGTDQQIEGVKRGYGVYSRVQGSDSSLGYLVDHTTAMFVIDPDGNYRLTYPYGTDPPSSPRMSPTSSVSDRHGARPVIPIMFLKGRIMSSRSVSRRTMVTGAGAATLAAAAGGLSWGALAHDESPGVATPHAPLDLAPASGTPLPGADPHQAVDGGSGVGGLYLTVTNGGREPDAILGGTTAVCAAVEPHAMRMDGDVMAMVFLPDGLPVPAGATVSLEPSGDHVMLVGLTQDLRPDTTFPISLLFRRAGIVDLISAVRWVTDGDDPDQSSGGPAPVISGNLTISTVWSRPAPMISSATAALAGR